MAVSKKEILNDPDIGGKLDVITTAGAGTNFLADDGTYKAVGGGTLTDGDKGDVTVSSSGTVWTIDNLAVTNAKINDVAWSKVTGEPTTLSGYGISDTKANFNTACSDGDFLFVGDVTSAPKIKSGVAAGASFAGNPKKITITFSGAFADANYSPVITGASARSWSVESVTASGFVINSNANTAPTGNVYWSAIKHGEN